MTTIKQTWSWPFTNSVALKTVTFKSEHVPRQGDLSKLVLKGYAFTLLVEGVDWHYDIDHSVAVEVLIHARMVA